MKKNLNLLLVFSAFVTLIYACRKDASNEVPLSHDLQWAKSYYENVLSINNGTNTEFTPSRTTNSQGTKKANKKNLWWGRATVDQTSKFDFVEIPIFYSRKIISLIGKKDAPFDMEVAKASFDRLIIYKDKTGKIDQRIVSFVPDREYLRKHNGDISHNKINNLDRDFEGYLIYKTWNDITVNRLRVDKGKVKSLKQKNLKSNNAAPSKNVETRPGSEGEFGCTDYYDIHWEIMCYYEGDNPIPIYCDEPEITSKVWVFTECPDDPPGGGDCEDPINFPNPDCVGGGGSEEFEFDDWGPEGYFGYSDEEINTVDLESDLKEYKNKFVSAYLYTAGSTLKFKTYEKIVLVNPLPYGSLSRWYFDSINHLNITAEGTLQNMTVDVIVNYTNGSIHNDDNVRSNSYAKMEYSFKDKRTKVVNGITLTKYSGDKTGERKWHFHHLGVL